MPGFLYSLWSTWCLIFHKSLVWNTLSLKDPRIFNLSPKDPLFFWLHLSPKDSYVWGAWWHLYVTLIYNSPPPQPDGFFYNVTVTNESNPSSLCAKLFQPLICLNQKKCLYYGKRKYIFTWKIENWEGYRMFYFHDKHFAKKCQEMTTN